MQESSQHAQPSYQGHAGPGIMLLSAALFGYFGFAYSWDPTGVDGQFLPFVVIVEWSLKGGAIGFVIAAVLSFLAAWPAEILYAAVGIITAVGFVVGGTLDLLDDQHTVMSPFLLFFFAAWNGYGSIMSLKSLLRGR